jgi:hypothetical protein
MVYDYLVKENKQEFLYRVASIAASLGIDPDWLMIVFKIESNIDHRAVNPMSGATGLIQFMPSTARGLGTSTASLKTMSNVQQLDYVYKYFKPYAGRLNDVTDLYTVTFFPRALGKPDNYVLQTDTLSAGLIASQNRPYDINRDNQITLGELKQSILKKLPNEALQIINRTATQAADFVKKKPHRET